MGKITAYRICNEVVYNKDDRWAARGCPRRLIRRKEKKNQQIYLETYLRARERVRSTLNDRTRTHIIMLYSTFHIIYLRTRTHAARTKRVPCESRNAESDATL